ncbi:MAG: endonuclease V [Isosphaeraceae bacterium]|jgi:deoxyribonuclease V|nr:MAG: endonuclease V [Isosphaeraceae bacterium]
MRIAPLHDWDLSIEAARQLQTELAARIDTSQPLAAWSTVAAADVSYQRFSPTLYAAVVVVEAGTHQVLECSAVSMEVRFPYVPGFLSFRELPPLLEAFRRLTTDPDVVLCDGQGLAHPRRLGLACHLGLWLERPTIGCAKSRLVGDHDQPGPRRGDRVPLIDRGELVGAVVRTRDQVRPVYVSPGHRCDLDSAIAVVLGTSGRTRLPEPARLAHHAVNQLRQAAGGGSATAD